MISRRKVLFVGAVCLPLLLLAALLAAPAPAGRASHAMDQEELNFLALINDYRAQNGAGPLTLAPALIEASEWFANDLATDDYFPFSHRDNENPPRDPNQRAAAFGWNGGFVGENILGGVFVDTAQEAIDLWKGSPGHNASMLYAGFSVIGIGRGFNAQSTYSWYWVTDFSSGNPGGVATPTATPTATPSPTAPSAPTPTPALTPTATPERTAAPTATPSPTATAPPTATATPTPTPLSATATPAGVPYLWGDVDCGGQVTVGDAQKLARLLIGFSVVQDGGCPPVNQPVRADGRRTAWGDVDCNGQVSVGDAIKISRALIGMPIVQNPRCFAIGSTVGIS
ncbi:MAG: CAP domain-containing protein [Dehalococcoidia bacterium]|nr:CAP domain-containing protein [Dehalococcoidia bacterium]